MPDYRTSRNWLKSSPGAKITTNNQYDVDSTFKTVVSEVGGVVHAVLAASNGKNLMTLP